MEDSHLSSCQAGDTIPLSQRGDVTPHHLQSKTVIYFGVIDRQ
jgi:hypothetical protein